MEAVKACHTFVVLGCPTSPSYQGLAGVIFILKPPSNKYQEFFVLAFFFCFPFLQIRELLPLLEFVYLCIFTIKKSTKGGRMFFIGIHKVA